MTETYKSTSSLFSTMFECDDCGNSYELETDIQICECGEPLRLDLFTGEIKKGEDIWERYAEFFPLEIEDDLKLGEGGTPLSRAPKISKSLDLDLYLKNETMNPTWSFKDRGTVLSVQRALDIQKTKLGTVSTGNMAASVSAYGARRDMETFVLVPSDISEKKVSQISSYGPNIIKVHGDYGELYYESFDLAEGCIHFTNSNSPFRVEGYKTMAFEIFEEIKPDYVIIPTSSGGLFRGITKGIKELQMSGIIDYFPTLVSVQAEGCSPICRAYESGEEKIKRWSEPDTTAKAISNPFPPGGNDVLKKLKELGGICTSVSDEEIAAAQKKIAREGVFCQPSSAVGVAALKELRNKGIIEEGADVVSIITGSGLKTGSVYDTDEKTVRCDIKNLEDHVSNFL